MDFNRFRRRRLRRKADAPAPFSMQLQVKTFNCCYELCSGLYKNFLNTIFFCSLPALPCLGGILRDVSSSFGSALLQQAFFL